MQSGSGNSEAEAPGELSWHAMSGARNLFHERLTVIRLAGRNGLSSAGLDTQFPHVSSL